MMILSLFLLTWNVWATDSTTTSSPTKVTLPPLLRGRHHYQPHRGLLKKKPKQNKGGGSSQQSTYQGCLGYSESELSESWIFSGDAPGCSWSHSNGDTSNGGSGSNSTNDGNDNDSSYDGNGDTYGGGWDDESDNGNDERDDGNGDGDGSDGNDDGSGNQDSTDDQVVVQNEKVYSDDEVYDPIDDFDIQVCDTYENLWIWDLALSCDNITQQDALFSENIGCNCAFAQALMENELLDCQDLSLCPGDCRVCSVCLELLGCGEEPLIPRVWRSLSALSVLYIVGAAVGLLLFGLVAHYSRKHWNGRNNNDDLDENLLDTKPAKVNPSMLYMHDGDLAWKPLPSDQDYVESQQQGRYIQPTSTMSTASTGKMSGKTKKAQVVSTQLASGTFEDLFDEDVTSPNAESTNTVPSMVDTFRHDDSNITMGVSPIQTLEESSDDASEDNRENDYDDGFEDEDPVFEDLSPKTTTTAGESGDETKDEAIEKANDGAVV